MIGYSTHSPEWIVLDPRTEKLRYTYSVTFDESKSGFEPETHSGEGSIGTVDEIIETR